MFADASWPAHGVFFGHLSLSVPSFSKPGQTSHGNTARGLITRALSASDISDLTQIPTAIIAFQCVTDIHTYTTRSETVLQD